MSTDISNLLNKIEQEAQKGEMPIDTDVYKSCSKPSLTPILFTGNLNAKIGILARDLGKDEVIKGQPLIGAAGQLLRRTLYEAFKGEAPPKNEMYFNDVMKKMMFTNIVPYKPIGNKVFAKKIRKRFMPFLTEFLIEHWNGNFLMTLGTEAFKWFEFFCDKEKISSFWKNEEKRYEETLECKISTVINKKMQTKKIIIAPLPHPSPLNAKWYAKFPELLKNRIKTISNKI